MKMTLGSNNQSQMRTYERANSVVFLMTKEYFGGLSNMASGFPLHVNDISIRTSEALYQACRFPHLPDVQRLIIEQKSPMTAKMKAKPHLYNSRPDWNKVRTKIMRWCLRVKLAQNWRSFSQMLLETGDRPIVERSRRDDFWGAKTMNDGSLVGMNILGRLLMELREQLKTDSEEHLRTVKPLSIPEFLLFEKPIKTVCGSEDHKYPASDDDQGIPATTPALADDLHASFLYEPVQHNQMDIRYTQLRKSDNIKDLQPYPAHRNSGVSWFGDIPEHWEVRRLRNVMEMRVSNVDKHIKEDEAPVRLCNYVDVYKNDYISEKMNFMKATATSAEIIRFRLEKDDVLITKDSETWDDIGVPALVTKPAMDLISGYHLALFRPYADQLSGGYMLRALQSKGLAYQFHVEAKGVTRYGLSHSGIKSAWMPLPPLPEQSAIVRYLDYVDRRVRRFVRAKEKLIGLLEEQKQVIIHRVVTRGLDPDVPLKPSGVEWLGNVPKHWEVLPLKHWVKINDSVLPENTNADFEFDYLDIGSVGTGILVQKPQQIKFGAAPSRARRIVSNGDTIVSTVRTYLKAVWHVDDTGGDLVVSTGFAVLTPRHSTLPKFVSYLAQSNSFTDRVTAESIGIAYPAIAESRLGTFHVSLPPLPEQTAIVKYLDKATADIDTTITRARREVELLNEYRTRLIADVVTGKLDVREAAAQLPDQTGEPESP